MPAITYAEGEQPTPPQSPSSEQRYEEEQLRFDKTLAKENLKKLYPSGYAPVSRSPPSRQLYVKIDEIVIYSARIASSTRNGRIKLYEHTDSGDTKFGNYNYVSDGEHVMSLLPHDVEYLVHQNSVGFTPIRAAFTDICV